MVHNIYNSFSAIGVNVRKSVNVKLLSTSINNYPKLKSAIKCSNIRAPIFVVGSPRSGTTLIGNVLGAAKGICSDNESLFLIDLWRTYIDLHQGANTKQQRPLSGYISEDALLAEIKKLSDLIFSGVTKNNKCVYLDHTPWYGLFLPFLLLLYPDARVVHVVRKGRWVVDSLTKSYSNGFKWAGDTMEKRTEIWQSFVQEVRSIEKKIGDNYTEVQYDSFIKKPEITIRNLFKKLDIAFDNKYMETTKIKYAGSKRKNLDVPQVDWPDSWTFDDINKFKKITTSLKSLR